MSRYASTTTVPVDRTRTEIESTLRRYDATAFGYAWTEAGATIIFEVSHRRIRMVLPLPDRRDRQFTHHSRGPRDAESAERAYEQACRALWRALLLIVKAKLEAVSAGITTVEREFLADVVLPNGATVGEWTGPQIAAAYERNEMPALLPGVNGRG